MRYQTPGIDSGNSIVTFSFPIPSPTTPNPQPYPKPEQNKTNGLKPEAKMFLGSSPHSIPSTRPRYVSTPSFHFHQPNLDVQGVPVFFSPHPSFQNVLPSDADLNCFGKYPKHNGHCVTKGKGFPLLFFYPFLSVSPPTYTRLPQSSQFPTFLFLSFVFPPVLPPSCNYTTTNGSSTPDSCHGKQTVVTCTRLQAITLVSRPPPRYT